MRFSSEIVGLRQQPRFRQAQDVFDSLLKGEMPDEKTLKRLYGPSHKKIMELAENFLNTEKRTPKPHDPNAPCRISQARIRMANDKTYQHIQHNLLNFSIPDEKYLKKFFGQYSRIVQESYKLFLEAKKVRKSGISMTCHHNRVACTFHELGRDDPQVRWYVTIAALHDFIEDLMYSLKDEDGKTYIIEHYEAFVGRFIPADLQEPVKLLTNHYDMIIKYVDYHLDKQGK